MAVLDAYVAGSAVIVGASTQTARLALRRRRSTKSDALVVELAVTDRSRRQLRRSNPPESHPLASEPAPPTRPALTVLSDVPVDASEIVTLGSSETDLPEWRDTNAPTALTFIEPGDVYDGDVSVSHDENGRISLARGPADDELQWSSEQG